MYIGIDLKDRTWKEIQKDDAAKMRRKDFTSIDDRSESVIVATVTEDKLIPGKFSIAAMQYYDKGEEFELTITQPIKRAIRTFIVALFENKIIEFEEFDHQ
jgi:hypothetical protein